VLLFLDCETSGLPRRWNAPLTELSNWPRVVQLAWIVCDEQGTEIENACHLVAPDGWTIDPGATRQHGITSAHARRHGEPLRGVLDRFGAALQPVKTVVAHNVSFDLSVVGAEFLRAGQIDRLSLCKSFCTMRGSADVCRIPGKYGFKWPTLAELHEFLFGTPFTGAHDAAVDCDACRRCYFAIRERTTQRPRSSLTPRSQRSDAGRSELGATIDPPRKSVDGAPGK